MQTQPPKPFWKSDTRFTTVVNLYRIRFVFKVVQKICFLSKFIIDILITYSTRSLSTMRGENIEIQKSISKNQSGPSVLRVMDPYQRLFFFSIDLCKTWFVSSPLA